jgi:hypothetical protein
MRMRTEGEIMEENSLRRGREHKKMTSQRIGEQELLKTST